MFEYKCYCNRSLLLLRSASFIVSAFQLDLNENLFGQPLVLESVGYAVKSHYAKNDRNQKPLVLSFHGMQGSGKNYVSDFIVKHTFRRNLETGQKSQFVHFFNGRLQFPLERHIHTYKVSQYFHIIFCLNHFHSCMIAKTARCKLFPMHQPGHAFLSPYEPNVAP